MCVGPMEPTKATGPLDLPDPPDPPSRDGIADAIAIVHFAGLRVGVIRYAELPRHAGLSRIGMRRAAKRGSTAVFMSRVPIPPVPSGMPASFRSRW